jgi:hypothetical protein
MFFGFRFQTWHAPWGYHGLQTGIEFALPPGLEVGVACLFASFPRLGLKLFRLLTFRKDLSKRFNRIYLIFVKSLKSRCRNRKKPDVARPLLAQVVMRI